MENKSVKIQKSFFVAGLIASILLGLLPFIVLTVQEKRFPTVIPEVVDDSLYYYARTAEVAQGHPLIGNPYYVEHRADIAPAFFVTDWFAALPAIFHLSMNLVIFFDIAVWIGIFYFIGHLFFKRVDYSLGGASVLSFFVTLSVLWLLVRPVSMQIVFPFFFLMLLVFYDWLADRSSRRKLISFAVIAGVLFYIYSYAAQLVVLLYVLLGLWELYTKQFQNLKRTLLAGCLSLLIALPSFYFLYRQIENDNFWQTMTRTGLIPTHSLGGEGLLCLALVFLGLVIIKISFPKRSTQSKFFAVLGLGLGLLSISNVFTGKDLETAVHAVRFVDLWFVILFFSSLPNLYRQFISFDRGANLKKIGYLILMLICGARFFVLYGVTVRYLLDSNRIENTASSEPLIGFLKTAIPDNAVVMADDKISGYVPVYTKAYTLFYPAGGLQLVSDEEVFERYALSRINTLTEQQLVDDMRLYRGVGPSEHVWKNQNRIALYCGFIQKLRVSAACPPIVSRETYYGPEYFNNLYKQYSLSVQPNVATLLSKYHVQYVVVDKTDPQFVLPKILLKKPIYEDQSFIVYSLGK